MVLKYGLVMSARRSDLMLGDRTYIWMVELMTACAAVAAKNAHSSLVSGHHDSIVFRYLEEESSLN